jgi:hypothetical protein
MTDTEINLSKKYEDFYPKNFPRKNNFSNQEKELENIKSNSKNKVVSFKEYIPKKRILNQQIHPLEKEKVSYYPKHKSKFSKEKSSKKEEKKEKVTFEEEDDYSGLAGDKYYNKNNKFSKWKNTRRSEDTNDFRTKWKTEICHYWEMYGFCKYGESCAFAHGYDELNKRKMSNNYKTKPCKQFFELGVCSYGVRCQFSHKKEDYIKQQNEKGIIDSNNNQISYLKIIKEFLSGENNNISHELIKRPRLKTFENIANCSLQDSVNSKLQLYEDIINIKSGKRWCMKNSEDSYYTNFSSDNNENNNDRDYF